MTITDAAILDYVDAREAPRAPSGRIKLHGPEAFVGMRNAGQLAAACLDMLVPEVKAGVSTRRLDDLAREFILDHGALPACIFYRGYRHTICTSLNHVVCHGIPGDRALRDDDIVNIDVTAIVDGWHGDTSRMYAVGAPKRKAQRLMDTTYEALMAGIAVIRPGATLGDVGAAIQAKAHGERFSVVREFCGHGLGEVFHDAPNVLHYGRAGAGQVLKAGMIFTVEPMINYGAPGVRILSDGWTAVTKDKSLTAQYEHSVGVTEDGVEIFTRSPAGLDQPHALLAASA
ncbi:MAG: type I methionyl aminopeptidase [Alphaproteobacteria bacterium]|nr:type I methionyl aminopeptidase [Alphaproteobacteria bacterium]